MKISTLAEHNFMHLQAHDKKKRLKVNFANILRCGEKRCRLAIHLHLRQNCSLSIAVRFSSLELLPLH